jgi:hypothetical protein
MPVRGIQKRLKDWLLQVGDASGIQSPLSFGGFGALTRHLGRLTSAITDAAQVASRSLARTHEYQQALIRSTDPAKFLCRQLELVSMCFLKNASVDGHLLPATTKQEVLFAVQRHLLSGRQRANAASCYVYPSLLSRHRQMPSTGRLSLRSTRTTRASAVHGCCSGP